MGLREVAAIPFDDASRLGSPQLSLFEDQVVLGGCEFNPAGELVWFVRTYDLTKPSAGAFVPIPLDRLAPSQDGYANALAQVGDSLAVVLGEASASAPQRDVLCVHSRLENSWQLFSRDAANLEMVVGYSRGASQVAFLDEVGAAPEIKLVDLRSPRAVRSVPAPRVSGPQALALNPSLTHLAVAHEGGVLAARLTGEVECTWPSTECFRRLWFAEDDLAVFGIARESMVLHQWKGSVQQFKVPWMRPHTFEQTSRTAFFWSPKSRDFIELDLSSGRARTGGTVPPAYCFDVDLRRRRIVTWSPGMMCRIFQMG